MSMTTITRQEFVIRTELKAVRETLKKIRECDQLAPLNLFDGKMRAPMFDYLDRRRRKRASVEMPISLIQVDFDGARARLWGSGEVEQYGFSKDVSLRGIGFTHDLPLESNYCVVTFDLLSGESISLLLEIRWANRNDDYELMSGGRFVGIVESPTV